MSHIKTLLITVSPILIFGLFNGYSSPFRGEDRVMMLILSATAITILAVIILLQLIVRDGSYFPLTILLALSTVAGTVISIPSEQYTAVVSSGIRGALIGHPLYSLLGSLFLMAVVPALFKRPFTIYFAKKNTPEAFWNTELFLRINMFINNIWAGIFGISFLLQFTGDPVFMYWTPLALKLAVGVPAVKFLPGYLQKKLIKSPATTLNNSIQSAYEAVTGMPLIFNKSEAAGFDAVFQFQIHGNESFEGYIEIKNGECSYHDGIHPSPNLTVNSTADTYLKIATGELSGQSAFLTGLYKLEGDLSLAIKLNSLFSRGTESGESSPAESSWQRTAMTGERRYSAMKPCEAKNILVIQGSPRKSGVSKTEMLTGAFIQGCRDAGAEVEIVNLREKKISHCTGCYTCWTKTPGVCAIKDDAAEIIEKEERADVVVYAWPLYHFGINSLMKKYIERRLPMLQPHLIANGNGTTSHPARKGYTKTKQTVLISVCGFPEVSHFGAASMNFHYLADSEGEHGMRIVAEIYRPGSEILGNPFLKEESDRVLNMAHLAGSELVRKGSISSEITDQIAAVNVEKEAFREMANASWDTCIREGKTLPDKQLEWSRIDS